jgi:hypothetical protein
MKVLDNIDENDLLFITIETESIIDNIVENQPLYACWTYKNMSLTPENSIEKFNSNAKYYPTFGKITTISVGKIQKDGDGNFDGLIKTYAGDDEKKILTKFNNFLIKLNEKNNKVAFIGYQNNIFDLPFILKRLYINGIIPSKLLDKSNLKPWEIKDVDIFDIWRGNSISVDNIYSIALQMGFDIPTEILIKVSSDKNFPRTSVEMFGLSQFKIKLYFNIYLRLKYNNTLNKIQNLV